LWQEEVRETPRKHATMMKKLKKIVILIVSSPPSGFRDGESVSAPVPPDQGLLNDLLNFL
jgi:hypothetical protein